MKLSFRKYSPLDASQQHAACVGLVQDDGVFAVAGMGVFQSGADCVAREFHTPMVASDSETADVFARDAPNLFTLAMSSNRLLTNWVYWADQRGLLRGKRIGLYYPNDSSQTEPAGQELVASTVKAELKRLGYAVTAEATSANSLGGPDDILAVQKFRAAGVDLAMLMISESGFMQQAKAQAYHPTYLVSDFDDATTDTAASLDPADQLNGSLGFTGMHYGEVSAGLAPTPEQTQCDDDYQRFTGRPVDRTHEAEYLSINRVCDMLNLALTGLQSAGRDLTPNRFVSGIEQSVRDRPTGAYANVSFSPTKHAGADQYRTLQWHADCTCWRPLGPFDPLWLP
ncbi:MAG: type 1 periplasmic-binding domain-containing protein [Acidimicrobiales bacterium]